jgi:hypothetical protein
MWPDSRKKSTSIQLEIDAKRLVELCVVVDESSKHLQSVHNNPCPVVFPAHSSSSGFLSLAHISDSDILKLLSA